MLSPLKFLLFVPLFFLAPSSFAQDNDYMKHMKIFHLCSFKKECEHCYNCDKQKFRVKIKNNVDKKIKKVSYVFYSDVYNRILTKEGVVEGDVIDRMSIGVVYLCLPNARHWAISEIVYEDGTSNKWVVKDRLETFFQEADECECNIVNTPD